MGAGCHPGDYPGTDAGARHDGLSDMLAAGLEQPQIEGALDEPDGSDGRDGA